MNRKFLLFIPLVLLINLSFGQNGWQQYFDGADTIVYTSLIIQTDTADTTNIWQVGIPQKTIFDSALTKPNVIVTDTINKYPSNDTSVFTFGKAIQGVNWSILAIRWAQKIDMDSALDGGIVEVSLDSGNTWNNIFLDQNVYNLYGFDTSTVKALQDSSVAFTGTDSVWRDIWLCYGFQTISFTDSIAIRFTFRSDSVDNSREGWMIDNMFMRQTFSHTVSEVDQEHTFLVYPTITSGVVQVASNEEAGKIYALTITDMQGRVMKKMNCGDFKAEFDISEMSSGNYIVTIFSDNKIESHKVFLSQ